MTLHVYVFKTSVTEIGVKFLSTILTQNLPNCKWNFDLEDRDNILRIESSTDICIKVMNILAEYGYECEELTF